MFVTMIESTPALRAAWLELHERLAEVARDELAAQAGVDPRTRADRRRPRAGRRWPRWLCESRVRHIQDGLRGAELRPAVDRDLERAGATAGDRAVVVQPARPGRAAPSSRRSTRRRAAEEARGQVMKALRQARAAWEEVRRERHQEIHRPGRRS